MSSSANDDDVEVARFGGGPAAALILCEHASERLPPGWQWPADDTRLAGTHWAYDPGARELALELAEALSTVAVLAGFTRLLADPNRPEESEEIFRTVAEGQPVALNQSITAAEREKRLAPWRAYHFAADREVSAMHAPVVLAMHTFTPVYEGTKREVEVGVLFDTEEALAAGMQRAIAAAGFRVLPNEPYSGKFGLMYSVERHARRHGRRAIELEVRQELAVRPDVRARLVPVIAEFLRSFR